MHGFRIVKTLPKINVFYALRKRDGVKFIMLELDRSFWYGHFLKLTSIQDLESLNKNFVIKKEISIED